jgi:hypothetical protein
VIATVYSYLLILISVVFNPKKTRFWAFFILFSKKIPVLPRSLGVFDGHAGISAARYMEKNLYRVFTEMLDMNSLGLDCDLDARVDEGLCCPLELHDVLTECYRQADASLLEWLQGKKDSIFLMFINILYNNLTDFPN